MRAILLCLFCCTPLAAATFTVTNLNDAGAGSLRDAIEQAEATAGADEIVFAAGLAPGTIELQTALPDITEDLTITGPASNDLIVQRDVTAGNFRIFTITGGTVEISHLWIGHGRVVGASGVSGTTAQGGGILNNGTLTERHCLLFDCEAIGGDGTAAQGGDGRGGGIASLATLALYDVAFVNCIGRGGNTISAIDPAGNGEGGGVYSTGTVTISRCTFDGCEARGGSGTMIGLALGGGVLAIGSGGTIVDSDFVSCSAVAGDGAVRPGSAVASDALTICRCSFRDGQGAAIAAGNGTLLVNCTITGNSGETGGVLAYSGNVTLRYCTITGNTGTTAGGIRRTAGTATIEGCIIAGNTGPAPDVSGAFTDAGFNLIGDTTGSSSFTTSTLVGSALNPINPGLGALQSFGLTWGHIPNWGSFAIDQGGTGAPFDDQRGANRLIGSQADIGSVEFIPNQAPSFTAGGTVNAQDNNSLVTVPGWATNISAGAPWETGQGLMFIIVGTSALFEQFPAIDPATGNLTFRTGRGYSGVWVFDVYLVDDGGTQGGGMNVSPAGFLVIDIARTKEKSSGSDEFCSTGPGTGGTALLVMLTALAAFGWRLRGRRVNPC